MVSCPAGLSPKTPHLFNFDLETIEYENCDPMTLEQNGFDVMKLSQTVKDLKAEVWKCKTIKRPDSCPKTMPSAVNPSLVFDNVLQHTSASWRT